MKKKTICLITNWYPTTENPLQGVFFREQAIAMKEYFDFVVVHYDFKYVIWREDYKIKLCNREENIKEYQINLSVPAAIPKIMNFIKNNSFDRESDLERRFVKAFKEGIKENIDVFYCIDAQKEARYLQILSEACHKPYVVSEHGPVPWLSTVVSLRNKNAIEEANQMLVISNDKLRQIMMQDIKIPEYTYVGNMVDERKFNYSPSGNSVKTFIIVAAHVFYKNYDFLIAIMNRLKEITEVPFRLNIVGYNANQGYSKDAEALEEKIRKSKFSDCVCLIPYIEREKMYEIYNKSDAFVMTSIQEGMPVSALEAGCCGLPIFSTRCGGVEDYVVNEIGRIYSILDIDEFAEGLRDFLEEKICFEPTYIREYIINKFGREAFVKNMVNAFEKAMSKNDT